MLRGANPTPDPLSCPSASAVPSADLAAGAWCLTAAPHSPFVPSHPQWGVLGFQEPAVVTPPSPGLSHTQGEQRALCSMQLMLFWVCCVTYTDTPCNLSLTQVIDLLMSCLFVWTCGSEFTLPPSSRCSCTSLTQQQDEAAVCKWVSSPGVLQSCQECVSQNAFVIISWKQFLLLFQKKQEIAVCTLILTFWGRGKK